MDSQFKRILALVRKTGDRMVVTDQNGKDVYVVMGLDQYEDLLNDADFVEDETWEEEGLLDDAPFAPFEPHEPSVPHAPFVPPTHPRDIFEAMPPAGSKAETWDVSKMNQQELEQAKHAHEQFKQPSAPPAPSVPSTPPDASEEQYYLEPIE